MEYRDVSAIVIPVFQHSNIPFHNLHFNIPLQYLAKFLTANSVSSFASTNPACAALSRISENDFLGKEIVTKFLSKGTELSFFPMINKNGMDVSFAKSEESVRSRIDVREATKLSGEHCFAISFSLLTSADKRS